MNQTFSEPFCWMVLGLFHPLNFRNRRCQLCFDVGVAAWWLGLQSAEVSTWAFSSLLPLLKGCGVHERGAEGSVVRSVQLQHHSANCRAGVLSSREGDRQKRSVPWWKAQSRAQKTQFLLGFFPCGVFSQTATWISFSLSAFCGFKVWLVVVVAVCFFTVVKFNYCLGGAAWQCKVPALQEGAKQRSEEGSSLEILAFYNSAPFLEPEMGLNVEFGSLWPGFSSRAHFCLSGNAATGAAAVLGP